MLMLRELNRAERSGMLDITFWQLGAGIDTYIIIIFLLRLCVLKKFVCSH